MLPLWLLFYWKAEAPGGFWFYEPRETMVLCCWILLAMRRRAIAMTEDSRLKPGLEGRSAPAGLAYE